MSEGQEGTAIDRFRSKRHEKLGDPGEGAAKILDKGAAGIHAAVGFLKKMELTELDLALLEEALAKNWHMATPAPGAVSLIMREKTIDLMDRVRAEIIRLTNKAGAKKEK